jgi:hypothetical protein
MFDPYKLTPELGALSWQKELQLRVSPSPSTTQPRACPTLGLIISAFHLCGELL